MSGEATRWAARRALGALSTSDQARFDAWMAADPRHRGELVRAEAGLVLIARAHAIAPTAGRPNALPRQRLLAGLGVAALGAAAAAVLLMQPGTTLTTRTGEIRRDRLADASVVTLNTQSRITVDIEPRERRVALDRGEAWFQVAHDRTKPFVVSAGDVRVRAVGTAFAVRRLPTGTDVVVTEGRVEIWRTGQPDRRTVLDRGRRAFAADDGLPIAAALANGGPERALAWRAGHLELAGESVDYAVSELNRYNTVQLRVVDPELGRKPIIGRFAIRDPLAFARAVGLIENARISRDADTILLQPTDRK